MAPHPSPPPPPPPEYPRPSAADTIRALGDDQLREIFLPLRTSPASPLPPSPAAPSSAPSARPAPSAAAAERSTHPPLLALFLRPCIRTVPTFPATRRPSAEFEPLRDDGAASDSERRAFCSYNSDDRLQLLREPEHQAGCFVQPPNGGSDSLTPRSTMTYPAPPLLVPHTLHRGESEATPCGLCPS
ncbi:hypothetical protein ZWY2020_012887 [Hordeum vulgare]|nr:hypothetical protein ZWY2020_012878 [Hordeum vulgare]KAI5010750.1 hypothetical protein ZWY2020_012887 [Hordeum vulgare]